VLTGLEIAGTSGLELLRTCMKCTPSVAVLRCFDASYGTIDSAIEATKDGRTRLRDEPLDRRMRAKDLTCDDEVVSAARKTAVARADSIRGDCGSAKFDRGFCSPKMQRGYTRD